MKRRGFLGLVGGAAVAGPSVAKEAVAKLPVGLGDAVYGLGAVPTQSVAQSRGGFLEKADRIADLKRMITGEWNAEERRRQRLYNRQQLISQEVASLRSVSGVRKLDIYHERNMRLQDEIQRSHYSNYLERLLAGKDEYY